MTTSDRLQHLLDKSDIADVIHAYCFHFNRNEPDAVAALFTADAIVDYGPEFPAMQGIETIAPAIARGLHDTFAATSHHVSNIVVTFEDADQANSICYLYAWHRYQADVPDSELWAQYHHRFHRTAGGWKIAELTLRAAGAKSFHRSKMHPIGRK
ncbi:nuclear transport factor 2 family protein [Roseicitreum antarcticum]|uniref:nuclear transport factor 2 family protein n=1 Tax=Roseicitreum antarcticum TaxID=564137 RepID=UPI000A616450|nr:nuclear transport factor 2 family protein [Roseicitreum antarcticum]